MTQLSLIKATSPEIPACIDLRLADVADVLEDVARGTVDLVVADPPWGHYSLGFGNTLPHDVYQCISEDMIGQHLQQAVYRLRAGGRLALGTCWPLLVEALHDDLPAWLKLDRLQWKTGGAWSKDGPPSNGYHWRGHSEPVIVGVRRGGSAGRARVVLRSGYTSRPEEHSRKPVPWIADWVRAWVPPGGLVLDLYAGLGSVAEAVAAAGEGRRYIGAEVDEDRHRAAMAKVRRAIT